jgi:cytochrome c biogenesis protein CcdA
MNLNLKEIGILRLVLITLSLMSLPMVLFADTQPQGVGVLTAYIIPALVVLFFFVLMLDALMNRVFMIEQPPEVQTVRRQRMWLDLVAGIGILIVWGSYFRTLLQM